MSITRWHFPFSKPAAGLNTLNFSSEFDGIKCKRQYSWNLIETNCSPYFFFCGNRFAIRAELGKGQRSVNCNVLHVLCVFCNPRRKSGWLKSVLFTHCALVSWYCCTTCVCKSGKKNVCLCCVVCVNQHGINILCVYCSPYVWC